MPEQLPLHPARRLHLDALSDEVAIMQHAIGSRPDPSHGYCTDDVARALQVDLLHQREFGWPAVAASAWRNVRFIGEALDPMTGRFRNFRGADGAWLDGIGSQDCHGRAMLALGETMAAAPDEQLVETAASLFSRGMPAALGLRAVRGMASVLLGCDAALRAAPSGPTALAYRVLGSRLGETFDPRPASAWPWLESRLTYENALPVRALLVAGRFLDSRDMIDAGVDLLDWLVVVQTGDRGQFSPIGNSWWPRGGDRSQFDQQPIEATALLLAAESAHAVTGEERFRGTMDWAYAWFLGDNDLGLPVADPERGASCDGLNPSGVNTNQGAESTLMWLIALEHIRAMRGEPPSSLGSATGHLATSGA
jgi:hypothetical protein